MNSRSDKKKIPSNAIVHVNASFNNTIITITNSSGEVLSWASAGESFKGNKKSTSYAAAQAMGSAVEKLFKVTGFDQSKRSGNQKSGIHLTVKISGPGPGRESSVRHLFSMGLFDIAAIHDVTGLPHNGCRCPKRRRI